MDARAGTGVDPAEGGGNAALAREYWACLCLRHCPGLGARTWKRVLSRFSSVREAMEAAPSWRSMGLIDARTERAVLGGAAEAEAEREYLLARERRLSVLTWFDPRYPQRLKDIPDPPVLLYCLGDLTLLSSPCVALVGSRSCSRYGFEAAYAFARGLSEAGLAVVSGLAHGIDRQAHLGGLDGVGGSIAVLGTGLDLVYPDSNLDVWRRLAETGLILTEFGPKTPPSSSNFPVRNRIISGLSLAACVIEAAARSGSLITARLAAEQGREVFAMPGPTNLATFRGCHDLINQGAFLAASAEDILRELAPLLGREPRQASSALPEPGRRVTGEPPGPEARRRAKLPPLLRLEPEPVAARSRPASRSAPEAAPRGAPDGPAADPTPAGLEPDQQAALAFLADKDAVHIDVIGRALGLGGGQVSRALVALELGGLVRRLPGMYYSRTA